MGDFTYDFALIIVNVIISIIIAIVIAFIIYYIRKNSYELQKQRIDINKLVLYIKYFDKILVELLLLLENHSTDIKALKDKAAQLKMLVDLDEFKLLDKEIKDKYRTLMTEKIVPQINTILRNSNVDDVTYQELDSIFL